VLEHVTAQDRVERGIRKLEIREVELKVGDVSEEVGCYVSKAAMAAQAVLQAPLGCEVEQRSRLAQQLRMLREKEPEGAVSLM
jgi:hypothetical protein